MTAMETLGISLMERVFRPRAIKELPTRGRYIKITILIGIHAEMVKCEIFRAVIFLKCLKLPIFDYHQY